MLPIQSLPELQDELISGRKTIPLLVEQYLGRIRSSQYLNAFITVFSEEALTSAETIQQKISAGTAGKLAGLILAVKDNICIKDHLTTAASKILANYSAIYNATVIDRLVKEDAVIIGKTNCDEFAMGGTNETSAFGRVLNPLNKQKVAGGSSGGSAAAVAASLCQAALGSDTGGSIRQPASFCGLVGLKPTYGRVSRYGLIAYGSSLDQIGPMTGNVVDAALLLEVIAGHDENDCTSSEKAVPEYSAGLHAHDRRYRVAWLEEPVSHKGLDEEIRERTLQIVDALNKQGHLIEPVSFPYLDYLVPAYYILATAEASSNMARYDGMHFGYRTDWKGPVRETMIRSRSEGFGTEVKRRIMTGSFVLSAGYYDAYYSRAQKVRRLISDRINEILAGYDFILLPATPHTAFDTGSMGEDPVALYLEDIFTTLANLAGIPAISLPLGLHSNGMPFGIQLMAGHYEEAKLLSFGNTLFENFHYRKS